jgi:hypothetical protein
MSPNAKGVMRMRPQMQGAHIFPEEYEQTSADTENIICLCSSCHKWRKGSWHKSPLEAAAWFNEKFPGRYKKLYKKAYTSRLIDWEKEYELLRRRWSSVLNSL